MSGAQHDVDKWALEEATYDVVAKVALLRATVDHLGAFLRRYDSDSIAGAKNGFAQPFKDLLKTHYDTEGRAARQKLAKQSATDLLQFAKVCRTFVDHGLRRLEPPIRPGRRRGTSATPNASS